MTGSTYAFYNPTTGEISHCITCSAEDVELNMVDGLAMIPAQSQVGSRREYVTDLNGSPRIERRIDPETGEDRLALYIASLT